MNKKRGLNKGRIDVLLSDALGVIADAADGSFRAPLPPAQQHDALPPDHAAVSKPNNAGSLHEIALENLTPGQFQPRREMKPAELQELAESIKQQGVLQPLVVRAKGARFEIIAGERRWRAAGIAGLVTVPAVVHEVSDQEAMIIALVENIQRENLNPLEEAYALERLIKEFGFTHEEAAQKVGKSRAVVSNLLRVLQLAPDVKKLLATGSIQLGHAKVLLAVEGKSQSILAKMVAEKGLSVRETERLLQRGLSTTLPSERPLDPDIARLQRNLAEKIGSPVKILHSVKGRGKLVITYNSIDELDGILEHIN